MNLVKSTAKENPEAMDMMSLYPRDTDALVVINWMLSNVILIKMMQQSTFHRFVLFHAAKEREKSVRYSQLDVRKLYASQPRGYFLCTHFSFRFHRQSFCRAISHANRSVSSTIYKLVNFFEERKSWNSIDFGNCLPWILMFANVNWCRYGIFWCKIAE